jgi:hypothetical protein
MAHQLLSRNKKGAKHTLRAQAVRRTFASFL